MNTLPLVSIVIPVYNGADYVAEAIDSALAQTYRNIEILVINDGSKDDGRTRAVAQSYGNKIRYMEKENGGVSTALNWGIREMKGDYFSWLSHDDAYFPEKIERQVRFLQEQNMPDAITYTDFVCMNGESELTTNVLARKIQPQAFKLEFILGGLLHGCSLLIPRKCFEQCGDFSVTLRATQDFDLWFRFAEAGFTFYHIPEILVKWRLHEQQVSIQKKAMCDAECNLMYTEFLKRIGRSEIKSNYPGATLKYYLRYSNTMLDYGYQRPAWYAFRLSPLSLELLNPRNMVATLRTGRRLLKSMRNKQ